MKRDQVLRSWPSSAWMVVALTALAAGAAFGDANWTGANGTQYDAAFITDNSTYRLDGPDAFFDCSKSAINLRSNSAYEGKGFTYPTLIVTNGATFKTGTLATGAGSSRSSAVVVVAGRGSTMLISGTLQNGSSTDSSVPSTNRVVVT